MCHNDGYYDRYICSNIAAGGLFLYGYVAWSVWVSLWLATMLSEECYEDWTAKGEGGRVPVFRYRLSGDFGVTEWTCLIFLWGLCNARYFL